MGRLEREHSRQQRSSVPALAMTVGLLVFFLTSDAPGGLTGVQGFFVGFSSVIILFLLVALLEEYKIRLPEQQKAPKSSFGDITIKQKEGMDVITIEIFVSKRSGVGRELSNTRKPYKDF